MAVVEREVHRAGESELTEDLGQHGREPEPPPSEDRRVLIEVPPVSVQSPPELPHDCLRCQQRQGALVEFSPDDHYGILAQGLLERGECSRFLPCHLFDRPAGYEEIGGQAAGQLLAQRLAQSGGSNQGQVEQMWILVGGVGVGQPSAGVGQSTEGGAELFTRQLLVASHGGLGCGNRLLFEQVPVEVPRVVVVLLFVVLDVVAHVVARLAHEHLDLQMAEPQGEEVGSQVRIDAPGASVEPL